MNEFLPFKGIKVLEWTQAMTGTWSTRCLSDFGAEIIKIESTLFTDVTRLSLPFKDNIPGPDRSPLFTQANTSKKSFTLDIKKPRGKEIFKKLVAWSDIVLQNQRPGLLKSLSLGYEELKKVKEDIIMIDVSIAGQEGPLVGHMGGWGSNSMAQSGQFYYYRFPEGDPLTPGFTATTDAIAPLFIGMTAIAALDYKRREGKGQYIDICQLESIVHFLGPFILNYSVNKKIQEPLGNRSPYAAPHNAFRCKGNDKWCAISISDESEWNAFCAVIGNPEWTKSPKFNTLSARKKNENELDDYVNKWTENYTHREVMEKMQIAGVPAGMIQNAEEIVDLDPQIMDREFLIKLNHRVMGDYHLPSWPFKMSKTRPDIKMAPCLGEHNHYICTEILGMSDEEFIDLVTAEIII